jgi:DNA-binding IclR family transcriptional regulator
MGMDSTERIISIVSYLAPGQKKSTLTEICRDLRTSKATTHRILSSLRRMNWVSKEAGGRRYSIGPALAEIGLTVISNLDLRRATLPFLSNLNHTTNETAMLSLRVGLERVFIEQVEGSYEVRMITQLGKKYPLWLGAQGKAILAYLREDEIAQVFTNLKKAGTKILASGQSLNLKNLRKDLAEIRRRGFAVSFGERVIGAAAVAAPIFGRDNQVVGAISVSGPLHRFTEETVRQYGPAVERAALQISIQLGASRLSK